MFPSFFGVPLPAIFSVEHIQITQKMTLPNVFRVTCVCFIERGLKIKVEGFKFGKKNTNQMLYLMFNSFIFCIIKLRRRKESFYKADVEHYVAIFSACLFAN